MAGQLHIKKRTKVLILHSAPLQWSYIKFMKSISFSFYMSSCVDIACHWNVTDTLNFVPDHFKLKHRNIEWFHNSELFNYSCSVSTESVILQGTIRLNAESPIVSLTIFHDLIQSLFVFPSNTFWLNMRN